MQIRLGSAGRFETALAERQGWTAGFAERVAGEYRRFLYLAATAGFEVTPSRTVDEAWHLHLASAHYRDGLCERILGRPLEHRPGTGEPGEEDRHHSQYDATLALYESAFGRPPPVDIWPRDLPPEKSEATKADRAARLAFRIAAAAAIAAAGAAFLGFPATALVLASIALVFVLPSLLAPGSAPRGSAAGCGGGCSGPSHDGGCGASCGGGGCGGGD
jgi:hypothetical protein